ncbi:L-asparaginase [Erwinia sp. OLMDLW33]|nr:L-asparaginase [Erwinia sp. OLMDLW33]
MTFKAILFAILPLGSARNPHVLRVRSDSCALSAGKLAATITPKTRFAEPYN